MSMSTDVAELRDIMREILELLRQVQEEAPKTKRVLQEEIRLLTASVALMVRATGTGDFNKALRIMRNVIQVIILVKMQITTLNLMLATTPAGALIQVIGIIGTFATGWGIMSDVHDAVAGY